MDDMQEKLGTILNDPQMMQQIQAMAQSFQLPSTPPPQPKSEAPPMLPDIDLGMVQRLSALASQSRIDKREQALLQALKAYLSTERVGKLEKAMKAAKLAKLASTLGPVK